MKAIKNIGIFFLLTFFISSAEIFPQIESSSIILTRGKLWQTVGFGKVGPAFSNWVQRGIGLDWPGFDPSLINENIGGSASYMVSGGLYVGAKWTKDSLLSVEEWSLYAGSVGEGAGAKYIVTKQARLYPNNENYWLKTDPNSGEEVIETVWEYNVNYLDEFQIKRMLPVRVRRTTHQWSGSKTDENYIIHDYVIKNISPEIRTKVPPDRFVADTLYDFYAVINYGIHCNSRSWSVLFPALTAGARNTWFNYSRTRRLVFGRATDYFETPVNEEFGLATFMGPRIDGNPTGEYLSPAYAGFKLLYSSRDKAGKESNIIRQGWSAASNSIDLSGPFTNIGSLEAQYEVMKDIRFAANFVEDVFDTVYMRKSRMWSLMQLGPWDIMPGDSIRIVVAEIVNGADYSLAIQPETIPPNTINNVTRDLFNASADRAQFTFENNFNHPDPPAAPEFKLEFFKESNVVANVIKWGTEAETIPDPDDGTLDLKGYIIYRSNYLPIGPWSAIDTVYKSDAKYFNGTEYTYIDSSVVIGDGYYYAITSFDTAKATWTGIQTITNVPALETSLFANRTSLPFIATLAPKSNLDNVLVVPNPFVIEQGFSRPGAGDIIQFANIPNPCTIRIYTIRGDLVKTINVDQGQGAIASWDQLTDYGQYAESGMYIYHIEYNGETKIGKFGIVR
ncbi:MAG: T9SS type A sorting domain-containing protein [Ignavibacteriaceae bacterium]|nr:T9SS type A sorting domain-containing protein [Ignavibacteriaceae bacterium]